MALSTRLELRQQQRLSLTPELRIRLSMLRMSAAELDDELSREAQRNPFLIYERPPAPGVEGPDETLLARETGFQESLRQQIAVMGLEPAECALAEFLIGELREDGYLDADLDQVAAELGLPLVRIEAALSVVQRCEPPGVGARNLPECLALQLVDKGLSRAEAQATVAQLAAFAAHDWAAAGAALGLDAEAARARAALMRGLSQRPVPETHARNAEVLRPDLVLDRRRDGVMRVSLAGGARRRLTLDEALVRRARAEGFEPGLLERAQALVAALEQRGQTLHRIGDWLLQNQTGFFHTGLGAIAPASRVAVAQDLGLHPSTVSRAVQGKAIDVDGRLWPLAVFFSAALSGVDGPVSAQAVRKRIGDLVAAETPGHPLSDETITGLLRAEGVDIARRTVAKYRQGLRIPSSSERRKIAAFRRGE